MDQRRNPSFWYEAANRYIKARRLECDWERIAKQAAVGMPSAPVPLRGVSRGFCIDFVRNGSCSRDQCKYKHQVPEKPHGRTPSAGGKSKTRAQSPSGKGSPSPGRAIVEWKFCKRGRCNNKGDKCRFVDTGQPSAPAPGSGRESSGERKEKKKDKKDKKRKQSRSSSRSKAFTSSSRVPPGCTSRRFGVASRCTRVLEGYAEL